MSYFNEIFFIELILTAELRNSFITTYTDTANIKRGNHYTTDLIITSPCTLLR